MTKTCTNCGEAKMPSEFGKQASAPDGLKYQCKRCISNKDAAYRALNRDCLRQASAKYRSENQEKIRARKIKEYAANPEKMKAYQVAYRLANPQKIKAMTEAYYAKNAEVIKERAAKWAANNPEKLRTGWANRRARKRNAEGSHTAEDIGRLKKMQRYKCAVCAVCIKDAHHVDHVIPLARGGSNWPSNLQLLCPPCNFSKQAKHPVDFMQERGFLL